MLYIVTAKSKNKFAETSACQAIFSGAGRGASNLHKTAEKIVRLNSTLFGIRGDVANFHSRITKPTIANPPMMVRVRSLAVAYQLMPRVSKGIGSSNIATLPPRMNIPGMSCLHRSFIAVCRLVIAVEPCT